jgi:histidinol phosphatase-like enzyme
MESPDHSKFRRAGQPEDWQPIPGRFAHVRTLVAQDLHVALITNQGGVAFGIFREQDMQRELEAVRGPVACGGLQ